ncbi:MAG: ExbD/TolR family protein [Panacagrimonas sp.]
MIGRRRRTRRNNTQAEMNMTAFMNLMVVLVPFLLITAVFTQLTIKELNLPEQKDQPQDQQEPPKSLTVVVRESGLMLADSGGPIRHFPRKADAAHDLKALSELLAQIKQQIPSEESITLLLEPDTPYDLLIAVMDAVHYVPGGNQIEGLEDMFPVISVGDAPKLEAVTP